MPAVPRSGDTRGPLRAASPLNPPGLLTVRPAVGKTWATPVATTSIACSIEAARKEAARLHPRGQWTLWTQVAVSVSAEETGLLNPSWVEWLMGFPEGWTELPEN